MFKLFCPFSKTMNITPKAKSFIRIDGDSWGMAREESNVSNVEEKNTKNYPSLKKESPDIPVISCIGTSRDGKSTFLNLYHNWLHSKFDKKF